MSWKCPECGEKNPNDMGRCLCGYDERLAVEQVKARTTGRGKASAMDRMSKPREIGELFSGKNIRLLIGLAYVALFFTLSPKHPIGYSFNQASDKATVEAGSAPSALLLGAIAIAVFIIMLRRTKPVASEKSAGLLRRLGAFFIDFSLLMITFGSISGLLLVYMEYKRTGIFLWYFQRDYVVPMEMELQLVLLCLILVSMVLYLAYPLTRRKQTIGCNLMSIMVVSDGQGTVSLKTAMKRVVFGFISLALAWITVPCAFKDPQRRMWHDKRTHTRVVLVHDGGTQRIYRHMVGR